MAKIDTSKIVGFEEMTPEQKVEALANFEFEVPDNSSEINHYKELISKANSEAAKYKKQVNERPSTDEFSTLKSEVETLRRDKTIADYTSQFIGLGYSPELAKDTATKMADGDTTAFFASQKVVDDARKAEFEKQKVMAQPTPVGGQPLADIDAEKAERAKLFKYAGF